MKETNCTVLIMAGGSGERFWPLSTKENPKQLLKLIDPEKSLIRMTVDRVLPIIPEERIFIATNAVQAKGVAQELPMIPIENIIIEPAFKDTAAAIGFGATRISENYPDSTMIVLASDHLIKDEVAFQRSLITAVECAQNENAIVTLGIKPSRPETGYGYLEVAKESAKIGVPTKVKRFCEKPEYSKAIEYLESGNFLWNSGMFIFNIPVMMSAFEQLLPNHFQIFKQLDKIYDPFKLANLFQGFDKISIDFGIMEKYNNTMVIPVDFGWNDIGSYTALEDVYSPNENSNIVIGVTTKEVDSSNNIVISTTGKKISLLGVSDLVIVECDNDIMICTKKEAQNIKKLI